MRKVMNNNKHLFLIAIAGISGGVANHTQAALYNTTGYVTGSVVDALGETTLTYTPNPLAFTGQWNIDVGTGIFSGDMYFGSYDVFTETDAPFVGHLEATTHMFGVNHQVGGTGNWDAGTLTLSFNFPTAASNTGGGSTATNTAPATCDGAALVCNASLSTSLAWEGLTVSLTFADATLTDFTGEIIAVSASGSGLTENITTISHDFSGTEVPLPAAAWLFGSGLLGLAGVARRRITAG